MNFEDIPMDHSWKTRLSPEFNKPYMKTLKQFLNKEMSENVPIYPPKYLIFNALRLTPFNRVKVVIIGQDPYHGPDQAQGLCFSVPKNIRPPPSLQNIFKELESDLGLPKPKNGSLVSWARQGVLLLNTTLTVRKGEPKSHFGKGWETFTDQIVSLLYFQNTPIVFLLWGKSAIDKFQHQEKPQHLVLKAPHPSPLSAYTGFFGCHHFSKTNEFLKMHNEAEINWDVTCESED